MAFKHVIDQVLLGGGLQFSFYPIEEAIGELLGIALDTDVGWLTVMTLVSITEFERIVWLSLSELHESKHFLELEKKVIVHHLLFILNNFVIFCVDGFQDVVPELRHHK